MGVRQFCGWPGPPGAVSQAAGVGHDEGQVGCEVEQWAAGHDCAVVALATRRAAPFYRAIGYEESAVYLRKIVP
jgi:hypothetical protein